MKYSRPRNEDLMMDTSLPTRTSASNIPGVQRFKATLHIVGRGFSPAETVELLSMLGLSVRDIMPLVDVDPDAPDDRTEEDDAADADVMHEGHNTDD